MARLLEAEPGPGSGALDPAVFDDGEPEPGATASEPVSLDDNSESDPAV